MAVSQPSGGSTPSNSNTDEAAVERGTISPGGLTSAEVEERVARGEVNRLIQGETRTVGEIVRANVFTRFNFLITALLVVILFVAPPQDALFGLVMVVNSTIGIIQEVRAKRTLDRLTLLTSPIALVVRDGVRRKIEVSEVVRGDLIEFASGDQIVVDCTVTDAEGLEVDESLLTGESEPVVKQPSDRCLSGSFVVAGGGRCVADAVGPEAYVSRLAAEARKFTLARSELREGIDWILRLISWLLPPTIGLLIWSQVAADQPIADAIAGTVAGGVAAVPQGLVLLTSIAFAVGVIRLGRRSVLVRELPAVEGLARVDTVCFDKTGTLTSGRLVLHDVEALAETEAELGEILGALGAAEPSPNATLRAVTEAHPPPDEWSATEVVAFSSARKWSGAEFEGRGAFVLGAPEVLGGADRELLRRAEQHASEGWRVLLLARVPSLGDGTEPPDDTTPLAMLVIGDEVRPEAEATLEYLADQGVDAKVISGDHPRTVGAVASRVGMKDAGGVVDGRELPEGPEELADIMERNHLFGRVTPQQKRAMIGALHRRGHVVAMTGDGVNDVLALKTADLGIAMGSGTQTTRSVAQVVLLEGDFSTVPHILTEGRRVAANIERVANLFLTKTVYAFLIALAVAIVPIAFPFLPRHLTLIGSLTIGIPAFFLALEGTAPRARRGFIPRVMRFAVPTGAVAATSTFLAYLLSREEGVALISGRTIATIVLGAVGVMALAMVCRPLNPMRRTVLVSVVAGFGLVFMVPAARDFFALEFPRPVIWLAAVGIIAITGTLLLFGLKASGWLAQASVRDLEPIANNIGKSVRDALDRLRGRG